MRLLVIFVLATVQACSRDLSKPAMVESPEVLRHIEVATTVAFTEGPTVDAEGTVYFTDITNNRIMRLADDGVVSTFRQPSNRANGLIFDDQWRLLACEGGDEGAELPRITRTDMETGEIEVVADSYEGKRLHQPNDLTFDGRGRIYFTDSLGLILRLNKPVCMVCIELILTVRSSEFCRNLRLNGRTGLSSHQMIAFCI